MAAFDAELATPLPVAGGQAARRQSPDEARAATNDLMAVASWARTVQGGGR